MNKKLSLSTTTRSSADEDRPAGRFVATSWTAIAAVRCPDEPEAKAALAKLCEAYWQPLHDYVRRLGHSEDEAKDLTQEFFLRAIGRNLMAAADRDKGRFRTFLLSSLNHFLKNEWHRANAAKRGGGHRLVSLDVESDDEQPLHEPANPLSPQALYDKSWAASVLRRANERLGEEYAAAGKPVLFEQLKAFLESSPDPRGYHAVAPQVGMTPNAIGVAVHRMRQRLRELIRTEVEHTLVKPTEGEIDAEMRFLLESLSR